MKHIYIILLLFISVTALVGQKGFFDLSVKDDSAPLPFDKDAINAHNQGLISLYASLVEDSTLINTKGFSTPNDGGESTYIILRDTGLLNVNGITAIQIQSNPNRYAIMVPEKKMDVRQFGVVLGDNVDSTTARKNFYRLKYAADFSIVYDVELFFPKGTVEVWMEPNEKCIYLTNNNNLSLSGTGIDESIIHIVPDNRHRMKGTMYLIQAGGDFYGDIYLKNITLKGKVYGIYFQTYNAILRADANARKIKLTSNLPIYSGWADIASQGDTIFINDDFDGPTGNYSGINSGFFVIDSISSIDSTIYTTTDISISDDYTDNDVHIGLKFSASIPADTVELYGKAWQVSGTLSTPLGGISISSNDLQEHAGIYINSTRSDYSEYSLLSINNCRISNFGDGVFIASSLANKIIANEVIFNNNISTALSYFPSSPPPPSDVFSIHVEGLELYENGTYLYGGQAGGDGNNAGGILGSGFYTHPNYGLSVERFKIYDNIAGALRQYSGSGFGPPDFPADYHASVFENGVFENNNEYNVFTSPGLKTTFRNVKFKDGVQSIHHSSMFFNCEFLNSNTSLNSSGGNDPDLLPEYGGGFVYEWDQCSFSNNSAIDYSSSWDKQRFSRESNVYITNSIKKISSGGSPLLGINEGSDSINQPLRVLIENLELRFADTLAEWSSFSAPFNGDAIPSLISIPTSLPGYVELILNEIHSNKSGALFDGNVLGVLTNASSKLSVKASNCDFSNWMEFKRTGSVRTVMRNCIPPGSLRNTDYLNLINDFDKTTAKAHFRLNDVDLNHTRDLNIYSNYQLISIGLPIGFSTVYTLNNVLPISSLYDNYFVSNNGIGEVKYIGNTDNLGLVNANSSYHRSIRNNILGSIEVNVKFSEPTKIIPNAIDSSSNILGLDTIHVGTTGVTLKYHPSYVYPVDGIVSLVDTTILIAVGDGIVSAFDGEIQQFLVPGSAMLETGVVTGTVVAPDENGVIYKGGVVQGLIDDSPYLTYRFEFDTAPAVGDSVFITCQMYNTTGSNVHRGMWEVITKREELLTLIPDNISDLSLTSDFDIQNHKIINLSNGENSSDAVNLGQLDASHLLGLVAGVNGDTIVLTSRETLIVLDGALSDPATFYIDGSSLNSGAKVYIKYGGFSGNATIDRDDDNDPGNFLSAGSTSGSTTLTYTGTGTAMLLKSGTTWYEMY